MADQLAMAVPVEALVLQAEADQQLAKPMAILVEVTESLLFRWHQAPILAAD